MNSTTTVLESIPAHSYFGSSVMQGTGLRVRNEAFYFDRKLQTKVWFFKSVFVSNSS